MAETTGARTPVPLRPWLAVLLAAAAAHAAGPEEILEQALARLQADTRSFSRYACIETVERQYFEPAPPAVSSSARSCPQVLAGIEAETAPPKLEAIDRLRLEVTVSEGREIYSWPGATRFDSRYIDQIIRQGPIATGSFGTHLLAVFDNPRIQYRFAGEETEGGRRLLEFRFHVPLAASQYRVRVEQSWVPIAYDGSFWLDAGSFALQRFTFWAEDVPAATSICRLDADLDYQRGPEGSAGFLLPSQSRLRIAFSSGRRTANLTTFSNCREYQAESEVVFEANPQVSDGASVPPSWVRMALPIGLPVVLALETPVDTQTAAAGDQVTARVVDAVRRPGSAAVLIPAGATVRGRLTRVEHHLLPSPYFLVAMSFNRLDWQGTSSPFAARSEGSTSLARSLGVTLDTQGGGLRFWDVGTFLFASSAGHYVIPAGFESKWTTLAPRPQ